MKPASIIAGAILSAIAGIAFAQIPGKPSGVQTNLEWTTAGSHHVGNPFQSDTTKPNALVVGAEGIHTLKTFPLPLSIEFDLTLKQQQLKGTASIQIFLIPGDGAFRGPSVGDIPIQVSIDPNESADVSLLGLHANAVYNGKPKLGKPYNISVKARPGKLRVAFESAKVEIKPPKNLPSPCYILLQPASQVSWEITNFKIQLSE